MSPTALSANVCNRAVGERNVTPAAVARATLSRRASGYAGLPWADDADLFSALLPAEVLEAADGVLDLGCGPGRLASWLTTSWTGRYVGVDVSPTMIAQADGGAGAEFLCADVEQLRRPNYDGWAFVVANILHYLNAPATLATLATRLGQPRTISVAETECPDATALDWVKGLFNLVWPGYRRQWFVDGDVRDLVGLLQGTVVHEQALHQRIDLDTWLATWQADERITATAYRHFDEASDAVAASLGLTRCNAGLRVMNRRQRVMVVRTTR